MLLRRTADGIPVLRLHYSADPDITPEWTEKQRKRYTSQVMWDLEMEINYEARSGQKVYPEYDPAIHVIPDSQIPRIGCLYMAIDPHPRTPHATLWLLIDEYSDWYIFRELWPSVFYGQPKVPSDDVVDPGYTVRDYAEAIAVLEGNELVFKYAGTDKERATYRRRTGGERVITRLMDYAAKGFQASGESQEFESFADKFDRYGIRCINPIKAHDTGEDAIHSLY
jgi:hypothetical protein